MHKVILRDDWSRGRAKGLIDRAPAGFVATIAEPIRSHAQNDKMHAMLTDIAISKPGGRVLQKDKWKALFMDALGQESGNGKFMTRWEPGLDGDGAVNIGYSSSRLTKTEMGELITFMQAWGDANEVRWSDPEQRDESA